MPRHREIVVLINTALKAGNFASRKFANGVWSTIAYLVAKTVDDKEIKQPVVVDLNGECTDVDFNDKYPIQFYHRILNIVTEDDLSETFGNPASTIKETSDMVLIVMGDKSKLQIEQEDIIAACWADIPRELKHADLSTLTLQSVNIIPGDINNNSQEVFAQENIGVDPALAPEDFMCALRYKIVALYSKNCFKLCNP